MWERRTPVATHWFMRAKGNLTAVSMEFRHETVDPDPPCAHLGFCLATDLTGNGRLDVVGKTYGPDKPDTHVDVWYNEA